MRDCECEELLCTCVDWGKDDLAARIHHIICNFEFTGFELEYTTLERPEGRRLCRIGRCRACGKRLCYGDDLPTQSTPDDLLAGMERINKQAHEAVGFTYTPLGQLAALQ